MPITPINTTSKLNEQTGMVMAYYGYDQTKIKPEDLKAELGKSWVPIKGRREQSEKNGGKHAWNGDFRRATLKRTMPETAKTQGERAKKSQPDKGWDFTL